MGTLNASLPVIEDCAQALGSSINGVPAGLQGKVGVYTFYATKLMTSGGQGGMVVSKNRDLIDSIKDYRSFDQRTDNRERFNFQMTDLQAAIGRVQLKKLPQFMKRREEIFQQYKKAGLPLLDTPSSITPVRFRAILLTEKQLDVIQALVEAKVKAVVPLQACHMLGPIKDFPYAHRWTKTTVSLPLFPSLSDDDVERIIQVLLTAL